MTLRAGIAGSGTSGEGFAAATDVLPGITIEAIASPNTADEFARRFGIPGVYKDYRSMIEETALDAVIIATPTDLHYDVCLAAAEAGLAVICAAPLASTYAEGVGMVHAVRRAGAPFIYAEHLVFSPVPARALDLAATGSLGTPRRAQCEVFAPRPVEGSWAGDVDRAGGGALAQLAGHGISLVIRALGDLPAAVNASVTGGANDDGARVQLRWSDGREALVECGWREGEAADGLVIEGSDGTIEASRSDGTLIERHGPESARDAWPAGPLRDVGPVQELQHLVDVVAGRAAALVGIEMGMTALEIVSAAYRSAATGDAVALPYEGDDLPPAAALECGRRNG